ncbi:MAG TPA: tRNA (guanosine(46)-N7)-methyltransferase TrmB [Candidatus Kapabacteria bacterium]|jgi:tRNA (guanine-N7-)-methyltransferase|nr:tRNA (guanosine(46)-N7)-methyltransferase TrmB [Candidatus Kapabacteria bacterium]HOM04584.1 tRNA (guanosine(46)-N7)-methyltransferase TrmB [Candidatus Kapabacteria bacterium]HPP39424.1 tRNA (guanosine(46)-N7)-methyltransferase TrmB [Candidatus Kapabacteria bacterium]
MIDFSKYPLPNRMRHHTSPNFYLPASELQIIPKGYPPLIDKIDWSNHFANSQPPDLLDIGCGRGKFLLDMSFRLPQKNILGIEVRPLPVEWLQNVIKGENLPNVSVLRYSVVNGLPFIEDNSIEEVFYLFPDPWPKKKHIKRRAFNLDFVREVHRILKKQGKLLLATDVPEVHAYHLEILNEFKLFEIQIIENDADWDYPVTNKEDFCRRVGIPFYRIICVK